MPRNSFDINIYLRGFEKAQSQIDKTKKGLDRMRGATSGVRRSIGALRNNLLLVSFTFGTLIKVSERLVQTYKKQIDEERKLEAGLRNIAGTTSNTADNLKGLAAQLQQTTTFGDETTISGMALLTTFQLNEATISELTPRMLDMAAAMGGDVRSAALQLGKAFTGQVSALSRSGVVIDKVGLAIARAHGPVEEAAFLFEQLDKNFKGFAEAIRNSPVGELEILKNRLSDVNEVLGEMSVPTQKWWVEFKIGVLESIGFLGVFLDELGKVNTANQSLIVGFMDALERAGKEWEAKLNSTTKGSKALTEAQVLLDNKVKLQNITLEKNKNSLEGIHEKYQKASSFMVPYLSIKEQEMRLGAELQILHEAKENKLIEERELKIKLMEVDIKMIKLQAQRVAMQKQVASSTIAMLGETTSKWKSHMKARQDAEIDALKETGKYREADADKQKQMEREVRETFSSEARRIFKYEQLSSLASIAFKTSEAIMKAVAMFPPTGLPFTLAIAAMGAAQAKLVLSQQPPTFAQGGDFVTSGPQTIVVGDNPGGKERVKITPLSSPNINGPSETNFTVNVNAPLVDETVVDHIIPAIEQAVRRNQSNLLVS
jgi:hypothetical protein|tara:strand:+ start:644 stop:2449 length:1806 start_codon:yes stop_codon:yes gene_type:complete